MRLKFLFFIICSIFFFSCSSLRVATTVLKAYPALPDSVDVAIYDNEAVPPENAIPLARISLYDGGTSKSYKYHEVLDLAKIESRKIGENIFYVTDVKKPGLWSSSYQLAGTALRGDTLGLSETKIEIPLGELKSISNSGAPIRYLPAVYEAFINYGYSGMLGSNGNIAADKLRAARDLNSGYTIDAGLFFYPKSWRRSGVGLLYSTFYSSATYSGINNHANVGYIGLDIPCKLYLSKRSDKWFFKFDYGIGYLYLKDKQKYGGEQLDITSSSLGINLGLGFEYSMTKRLAVHAEARAITGTFRKIKFGDASPTVKLDSDDGINGSRGNLTIGLLLRIGKIVK